MASEIEKRWRGKQALALYTFLLALSDHYLRDTIHRNTGMSLLEWAASLYSGKLVANMIGGYLYLGDDKKMEDWMYAESTIYGWYGLENTWFGAPLNLIPNPVGVLQIVGESAVKIGEHNISQFSSPSPHSSREFRLNPVSGLGGLSL